MRNGKLKASVISIEALNLPEKCRMFSIYEKYYENASREKFEKDLLHKDKVILLRSQFNNEIQGFSTLKHINLVLSSGKKVRGIFSGDTIIEKEFWGDKALNLAFSLYLLKEKYKKPFQPLYWFLISKGFKTYLLLANNFPEYYPSPEVKTPKEMEEIMDEFSMQNYPNAYNFETKTLCFGNHYDSLKKDVAPIDELLLNRYSKIKFFLEKNPNWEKGEELVCLGVFDWKVLSNVIYKILVKMKKSVYKFFGQLNPSATR
ncbi:MAG: hypothetical protein CME68_11960 [Halobacteriovoraceae bacterium]|nr:hypothetical protein [Halobacteriovoraceae bacterium]|tara:strand:- start:298 stop:1077 length:780 start_codon:yes stop_codon:yes gene_type:complete